MNRKKVSVNILLVLLCLVFVLPIQAEIVNGHCEDYYEAKAEWEKSEIMLYNLEVPLGNKSYVEGWIDYVTTVYTFVISAVGVLVVSALMYGGFRWAISAGNEQEITKAKETLKSAIMGLIIAVGSYGILYFINPALTQFVDPEVMKIPIPQDYDDSCALSQEQMSDLRHMTAESTGVETLDVVSGGCPNLKIALQIAANNMAIANAKDSGTRKIRGSAWRDAETQYHLRQCYCNMLENELNGVEPACEDNCPGCVKGACWACNPASEPCGDGQSYHIRGTAADVYFESGPVANMNNYITVAYNPMVNLGKPTWVTSSYKGTKTGDVANLEEEMYLLYQVMVGDTAAGYTETGLRGISNEWWHFQLKDNECGEPRLECPCDEGTKPTTCDSDKHAVCDVGSSSTWECEKTSKGGYTREVVDSCDTYGGEAMTCTNKTVYYECLVE